MTALSPNLYAPLLPQTSQDIDLKSLYHNARLALAQAKDQGESILRTGGAYLLARASDQGLQRQAAMMATTAMIPGLLAAGLSTRSPLLGLVATQALTYLGGNFAARSIATNGLEAALAHQIAHGAMLSVGLLSLARLIPGGTWTLGISATLIGAGVGYYNARASGQTGLAAAVTIGSTALGTAAGTLFGDAVGRMSGSLIAKAATQVFGGGTIDLMINGADSLCRGQFDIAGSLMTLSSGALSSAVTGGIQIRFAQVTKPRIAAGMSHAGEVADEALRTGGRVLKPLAAGTLLAGGLLLSPETAYASVGATPHSEMPLAAATAAGVGLAVALRRRSLAPDQIQVNPSEQSLPLGQMGMEDLVKSVYASHKHAVRMSGEKTPAQIRILVFDTDAPITQARGTLYHVGRNELDAIEILSQEAVADGPQLHREFNVCHWPQTATIVQIEPNSKDRPFALSDHRLLKMADHPDPIVSTLVNRLLDDGYAHAVVATNYGVSPIEITWNSTQAHISCHKLYLDNAQIVPWPIAAHLETLDLARIISLLTYETRPISNLSDEAANLALQRPREEAILETGFQAIESQHGPVVAQHVEGAARRDQAAYIFNPSGSLVATIYPSRLRELLYRIGSDGLRQDYGSHEPRQPVLDYTDNPRKTTAWPWSMFEPAPGDSPWQAVHGPLAEVTRLIPDDRIPRNPVEQAHLIGHLHYANQRIRDLPGLLQAAQAAPDTDIHIPYVSMGEKNALVLHWGTIRYLELLTGLTTRPFHDEGGYFLTLRDPDSPVHDPNIVFADTLPSLPPSMPFRDVWEWHIGERPTSSPTLERGMAVAEAVRTRKESGVNPVGSTYFITTDGHIARTYTMGGETSGVVFNRGSWMLRSDSLPEFGDRTKLRPLREVDSPPFATVNEAVSQFLTTHSTLGPSDRKVLHALWSRAQDLGPDETLVLPLPGGNAQLSRTEILTAILMHETQLEGRQNQVFFESLGEHPYPRIFTLSELGTAFGIRS